MERVSGRDAQSARNVRLGVWHAVGAAAVTSDGQCRSKIRQVYLDSQHADSKRKLYWMS
jgi:hypothetical protein